MNENLDKRKMLEILLDPNVSAILLELENGSKDSSYLSEKLQISELVIKERLSYLIQHHFVKTTQEKNQTIFSLDKNMLDKIMESDENFSGIVDGLTELDQYLN